MSAKSRRTTRRRSIFPDPLLATHPLEHEKLPSIEEVAETVLQATEHVSPSNTPKSGIFMSVQKYITFVRPEIRHSKRGCMLSF